MNEESSFSTMNLLIAPLIEELKSMSTAQLVLTVVTTHRFLLATVEDDLREDVIKKINSWIACSEEDSRILKDEKPLLALLNTRVLEMAKKLL